MFLVNVQHMNLFVAFHSLLSMVGDHDDDDDDLVYAADDDDGDDNYHDDEDNDEVDDDDDDDSDDYAANDFLCFSNLDILKSTVQFQLVLAIAG